MKRAVKIYDLTPKISTRLAIFPGDQPFSRQVSLSWAAGNHLELSSVQTTVHLGAHADAPSHYDPNGVGIDQVPLERYYGEAQVLRVTGLKPGARVRTSDLRAEIRATRVLIDTGSFRDPEQWRPDFNAFSPELLEFLADQGVVLVGIDTPSVDPADSKVLESHQVLRTRGLSVLEGLQLDGVPEGVYTLIALPLPIEGGDASPVRAVLVE